MSNNELKSYISFGCVTNRDLATHLNYMKYYEVWCIDE